MPISRFKASLRHFSLWGISLLYEHYNKSSQGGAKGKGGGYSPALSHIHK